MEALKNPEEAIPKGIYQKFLIMDILHLKDEEIRSMDLIEYLNAVNYCWNTYTNRRVDYNMALTFGGKQEKDKRSWKDKLFKRKSKGKRQRYSFEQPEIDDYIARSYIKEFQDGKSTAQRSYIPKRRSDINE